MSNIEDIKSKRASIHSKYFFAAVLLVLTLGRTWGLLDEYLAGRFLLISLLSLAAMIFVVRQKQYTFQLMDLVFLCYFAISAASLSWSILPSAGLYSVLSIGLSYVFYVSFMWILPELPPHFKQKTILGTSVLVVGILTFQLVQTGIKSGISNNQIYEITGWSGHKNLASSFLFLLFGFNIYYFISAKRSASILIVLILQVTMIFLLQSRAVFLAMVVLLGGLFCYIFFKKEKVLSSLYYRIIYMVAGSILTATIFFSLLGGTSADIKKLSPFNYMESSSGAERRFVWYKTRELIKDKWITGYGAGSWKLVFPSKSIEGSYRLQSQNIMFTRAHNDFLEIWAETGILGILNYIGLFLIVLLHLYHSFKSEESQRRILTLVLMLLLGGYIIIAFFDFPKERVEHTVLLSLLFAMATKNQVTPLQQYSYLSKGKKFKLFYGLMIFILIANSLFSFYQIQGEYHTRKALEAQLVNKWKVVQQACKYAYSPFYQITPFATSVKWVEGTAAYNLGKYEEAEKLFALGCAHTPYHFNCLNDYASCKVQLKKYQEAIDIYKKSLYINPRFEDALFNISFAYAQLKEYDQALIWVRKTKTLPEKKETFIQEIEKLRLNH